MDLNLIILVLFILFVILPYFYVNNVFQYWKSRGIPYIKPKFPYGILKGLGKTRHTSDIFTEAYNKLKGKNPFGGVYFFTRPVVLPTDLDLIKNILIKDFNYFHDRGIYVNERDDPLSGHLFALPGSRWRNLRKKLSPTFSPAKLKMMHSTIISVAKVLQDYLEPYSEKSEEVEIKDILSRFSTDVFGNCAYGIACNSLEDPDVEFRKIGKILLSFRSTALIRVIFLLMFQNLSKILRMKITKPAVEEYFLRLLRETTEYREKNNVQRNDFLSLLMQIMKTGYLDGDKIGKLTFEEVAAQMLFYYIAGFETSSSTTTFALYELAQNQDMQDCARQEILTVLDRHNGEYTYEACMEMTYVDQIIKETLRKHPIVDNLLRVCIQNYQVPGTEHVIEKGTPVFVSVYGIHHDSEIYPEPEIFDPERFSEENIKNRHPCAWIPFGEGPRSCVGMRFGMMQARVGLAHVIQKYRVSVSPRTPIPLILDPTTTALSPKNGMWLQIEKIQSSQK